MVLPFSLRKPQRNDILFIQIISAVYLTTADKSDSLLPTIRLWYNLISRIVDMYS